MKRLLTALLCVVMMFAVFPVYALADYSTSSNRGVDLEYPAARDYFVWPFTAQIQTYKNGGSIYLMPEPETGNGNLGSVANETAVVVLAERNGFFFFVTGEGHYGWAWHEWFEYKDMDKPLGPKNYRASDEPDYPLLSSWGAPLVFPKDANCFDEPMTMTVAELPSGRIHLMPQPEKGHGNLGVVQSGEEVEVLAEQNGFYFFQTADGRYGWNGEKWFE